MNQNEFRKKLVDKINSNTLTDDEITVLSTLITNNSGLFCKKQITELLIEYTTKVIVSVVEQTLELISEEINPPPPIIIEN